MSYRGLVWLLAGATAALAATINFTADTVTDFANPERGFAPTQYVGWPPNGVSWDFCGSGNNFAAYSYTGWTPALTVNALTTNRRNGMAVQGIRYHIFDFINRPFTQPFLDRFTADLQAARQAGVKLVPLFAYNWPLGGPDASLSRILGHLDQLRPIFESNADVIAFVETGFVGCWGEEHTSSNNHIDGSKGYRRITSSYKQIIEKLFAVLPASRMVAIRYPEYKFQYFNGPNNDVMIEEKPCAPLTAAEAFSGSIRSRWGHRDHGLVFGEWNGGSWWTPRQNANEVREFLNKDNLYVVQYFEPGDEDSYPSTNDEDGDGYTSGQYGSCERVLKILRQERASIINRTYDGSSSMYTRWQNEGCYNQIATRLGYRFSLTSATVPDSARAGGAFKMSFMVANRGWAAPYNGRGLNVLLRNRVTRRTEATFTLATGTTKPANLNHDPRYWQPDSTVTVQLDTLLPAAMPIGSYEVLLHLFDPAPALAKRPEYAIRFANQNVWEDSTGLNSLNATVKVTAGPTSISACQPASRVGGNSSALEIISIDGRVVARGQSGCVRPLSPLPVGLPAGIYFLRPEGASESANRLFVADDHK